MELSEGYAINEEGKLILYSNTPEFVCYKILGWYNAENTSIYVILPLVQEAE